MNYRFINTEYLEMVSGGNREITEELISIFRQQAEEFYEQLNGLLRNGKYKELGLLAHKAKSSVAIMGMEEMSVMLKEMEINARDEINTESYPDVIERFRTDTTEAIKELEHYISTLQ